MRLDPARHRAQPWRVHSLAPDFELLDVWRIPIEADPSRGETFDRFFDLVWENELEAGSAIVRLLAEVRWSIGRVLGWDGTGHRIPGSGERSVAERLTDADRLADRTRGVRSKRTAAGERIALIYRFADEALVETSNATIAALWHLGWVDLPGGRKTAEVAVYIKSRGLGSRVYIALIQPFRQLFVYPAWTKHVARLWYGSKPGYGTAIST
jgi:hypothetical protein